MIKNNTARGTAQMTTTEANIWLRENWSRIYNVESNSNQKYMKGQVLYFTHLWTFVIRHRLFKMPLANNISYLILSHLDLFRFYREIIEIENLIHSFISNYRNDSSLAEPTTRKSVREWLHFCFFTISNGRRWYCIT